jgi:hypothetical protein
VVSSRSLFRCRYPHTQASEKMELTCHCKQPVVFGVDEVHQVLMSGDSEIVGDEWREENVEHLKVDSNGRSWVPPYLLHRRESAS